MKGLGRVLSVLDSLGFGVLAPDALESRVCVAILDNTWTCLGPR